MTNEEKARELTNEYGFWDYRDRDCSVKSAIKMANWKDRQFISILPEIFDYFENTVGLYDGGLDHSDVDKPTFIKYFSNIISNTK